MLLHKEHNEALKMHPFHFALLPAGHISNDLAIKLINVGQNESNGHIYIKPLLVSKLS